MRVGVVINEFASFVSTQTTAMLVGELTRAGHETFVFGVADLGLAPDGRVVARARLAPAGLPANDGLVDRVRAASPSMVTVDGLDRVLIRTNPARDPRSWAHEGALQLLAQVRDRGVPVINDPDGLRNAGSKVLLAALPPEIRPETLLSCDRDELTDFVRRRDGRSVLKPARGTRGSDVFVLEADSPNLAVVIDVLLRQGWVVAQQYVPAADDGDTRVVVLDGDVLELDGAPCAIRRVPRAGDFRSNLHAGGSAAPATVTPGMRAAVAAIAPMLHRWGLRLVGIDFLGDLVCELNAYATGGFRDAERFSGKAFTREAVSRLLDPPGP